MVQEHKSDYSNISPKKIKKYFMCLFCVLDYSTRVTVLKYKYKVLKYKVLIVSNKCNVLIAKKHENVCQSLLGTEKRTLVAIRYRKTYVDLY